MKSETALYIKAFLIIWVGCFVSSMATLMIIPSCGSQFDATELERIRAVTCPSVCAAYADAVDAGVEVMPEDVALMEVCKCL